ncbi:MAG: hypothetical protein V1804_00060 [Patescibacteria group bacterium]
MLFPVGKVLALTVSPPVRELSGEPGKTISGVIKLYNETKNDLKVSSLTNDFTAKNGEGGEPSFIPTEQGEEKDLASWIKLPSGSIEVKTLDWQNVAFSIDIPENAEPGGHYAAIFFAPSEEQVGGPGAVGVNYQTGSLVLLTVAGAMNEEGSIKEFITKAKKVFHDTLPVIFELRIENTGNVHFKPGGYLEIRNMLGQKVIDKPVLETNSGGNVLPHSIRRYDLFWGDSNEKNWPQGFFDKVKFEWNNFHLGRYKAIANVALPLGKTETKVVSFWIFPWQLLIVVAVILLALLFMFKQYNKWIIKKAREGK